MSVTVQFRCGARVIPAPIPGGSLDENVKQLMSAFPFFRFTTVLESDAVALDNNVIEYRVELPPMKTNG